MRLATAIAVALLLVACAPALLPQIERENGTVTLDVTANQDVWSVSATILDATTTDERCTPIDADAWCYLGALEKGEVVTITVEGPPPVVCTAAGYLTSTLEFGSYRAFACRAR